MLYFLIVLVVILDFSDGEDFDDEVWLDIDFSLE